MRRPPLDQRPGTSVEALKRGPAIAIAGGLVLAVGLRLLYGKAIQTYDPLFSLIWGRDLLHGVLPDFAATKTAPTPHPLANLVGALVSPLGRDAPGALQAMSFASFGALGVGAVELGRRLYSWPVGVLFAALVLTRPPLVDETLETLVDIPFLALVIWAAALEARSPRRGLPVLILLGVAGLLRPEGWALSAAYFVYLLPSLSPARRLKLLAVAAAAPVLWALFDLASTGDPFHSLHGTQELAELLARPRSASTAFSAIPSYLQFVIPKALLVTGLAGAAAGLIFLTERSLMPAVIMVLGLAAFLVLGLADLPLLNRYVFIPALMLALFAAVALLGWTAIGERSRLRTGWMAAGSGLAVVLALAVAPGQVDRIDAVKARARTTQRAEDDALHLLRSPAGRGWRARCTRIYTPSFLLRPLLAYHLDFPLAAIGATLPLEPLRGLQLRPAGQPPPPPPFREVEANDTWSLYENCG